MQTHIVWKTVTIGGKKEYTFNSDINIFSYAKDLQSKTPLTKKKESIDLVILTPKDLGFTGYPTTKQFFDEINLAKYGVELCPAEVGLALREQYTNQPVGEWLYIAMKPITDPDGDPHVFRLVRDGDGLWLDDDWADPGSEWYPGSGFVFRLRKVSLNLDTSDSLKLSPSDTLPLELIINGLKYKRQ